MSKFPTISTSPRSGFPVGVLLLGLVLGGLLVGGILAWVAISSLQRRADLPMEHRLAAMAKDLAIPSSASRLTPPGPLDDRRLLGRGR